MVRTRHNGVGTEQGTPSRRKGRGRGVLAASVVTVLTVSLIGAAGQPGYAQPNCNQPNPPPNCGDSEPAPPSPTPSPQPSTQPDPDAAARATCTAATGWHPEQQPPAANEDGTAPLAITQDAPFGYPLHAGPHEMIQYVRCMATLAPSGARVGLFCPNAGIAMDLKSNRTLVPNTSRIFAKNTSDWGKWFVTHSSTGETASRWVERGTTSPQYLYTISDPWQQGTVLAGTMGFVRTGLFGVAVPECSFTWTSFWLLAQQMDITYTWVY